MTDAKDAPAAHPRLHIRLLGDVQLTAENGTAVPRTRKARAMLAYLAATPGGATRQRLAALLWSDRGQDQARASVRQAVYELRGILGPAALLTSGEQVMLDPASVESDIAAILKTPSEDAATLLDRISSASAEILGAVDDVSEPFDEWLRETRQRLGGEVAEKARLAAEAALAPSPEQARRLAEQALRFDPYDERAVRVALQADAALGDLARLHRRYRGLAERLTADLGVEPSPATRQLYERLRHAEPVELPPVPTGREAGPDGAAAAISPPSWRRWIPALALLVLLLAFAATWWSRQRVPARPLIAVLPFQNLSRTDDPYFASGVAEEVQNLLSRAPGVGVLGRASSSEFERSGDVLAAARALHVTHLLDGSVRARGDRVLVLVRLIRTDDGRQLWSERYDRRLGDVFHVQNAIAQEVTSRFARRLPQARPQRDPPQPAVYDRYLAARSLMRDRRAISLGAADKSLREAIALQPNYAPAHALLAQVLILEAQHPISYGTVPYEQALAEATREATLATRLDPALGEAQAALGLLTYSDARSLSFYRRAVALDPQRADFHRWLGQSLMAVGRYDEALGAFRRAAAIDPLWELNAEHLVAALERVGREDEAAQVVRRFHLLSHDDTAKAQLDAVYADAQGRLADSYRHAARFAQLAPQERQAHFRLASSLAALGNSAAALSQIAPDDWAGRLSLLGRTDALEAAARRQGPTFWDTTIGFWNIGDQLVTAGKGATLLQLFDKRFGEAARFRPGEVIDAVEVAPLIVALREAGRTGEATMLLTRLQRQLSSERAEGAASGLLSQRAVAAALAGDRAATLRWLALAIRREPARLATIPYRPIADRSAFRWLAGEPALAAADRQLLSHLDGERRKLGWGPLNP